MQRRGRMSMLARYLPSPRLHQLDRIAVAAPPERAREAVRHVDGYRIGFVRALFALRAIPDVIRARVAGAPSPLAPHATIDDMNETTDFRVLEERPDGFAVGAIGTFWTPHIDFRHVEPSAFAAFDEPGYGKVVWGLEVAPHEGGGSWITFEVRVTATDDASFAKFRRYWYLIGQFSHAIRRAVLAMLREELGAAPSLEAQPAPGDELLPDARYVKTHAIRIEAPPAQVWPWLAQMGCGRGGWYTFDRLDNGGQPSAREVHPEWQQLAVGDRLYATPDRKAAFAVLAIDPGKHLVIGSPPGVTPAFRLTWAFALEPIGADATFLRARVRADYAPRLAFYARHGWEMIAHEVMQRRQLHNLRERAEHDAGVSVRSAA